MARRGKAKTRRGEARQDNSRHEEKRQDETRQEDMRRGEARPDQTRQDKTRQGVFLEMPVNFPSRFIPPFFSFSFSFFPQSFFKDVHARILPVPDIR